MSKYIMGPDYNVEYYKSNSIRYVIRDPKTIQTLTGGHATFYTLTVETIMHSPAMIFNVRQIEQFFFI